MRRRLRERWQTARRDLAMVVDALRGNKPPPLVVRPPSRARRSASEPAIQWRSARVRRVVRETADTVTLVLDDDIARAAVPGQFLTVELHVSGERLRRAYSLSRASGDDPTITVKRIADGRASGFIHDEIREGSVLYVRGPSGTFTVEPDPETSRQLVMIAGGSGITPVRSILQAVLETEPGSRVLLLYGNRSEHDVIFGDALRELEDRHAGRFEMVVVLEDAPPGFTGRTGRLDAHAITELLEGRSELDDAEWYVCGPEPMRTAATSLLRRRGVRPERVHEEVYVRPRVRAGTEPPTRPQAVVMRCGERRYDVVIPPGDSLLEAGLAAGAPMPFSCAMGGCAACKVRLVDGDVVMDEPNCLREDEKRDGWVLACVSRPRSRCTVEIG